MAPIEPPEVERKHAVATGASQGLGRALLDAFLAHGYCVSFCARRAERIAEITAALTADSHGDRICGYAADISAPTEMAVFWQVLSQRFGTATASGVPLAGTRAQGFGSLYSMGGAGGAMCPAWWAMARPSARSSI
ncbi:MAG: SDR family NAD(P)-dependent oxidoreductase [Proteobacteria bacterium]|nr:SDR family NAD(P)-dependent oxidoreductase [Pseudomonadota bacterium]